MIVTSIPFIFTFAEYNLINLDILTTDEDPNLETIDYCQIIPVLLRDSSNFYTPQHQNFENVT